MYFWGWVRKRFLGYYVELKGIGKNNNNDLQVIVWRKGYKHPRRIYGSCRIQDGRWQRLAKRGWVLFPAWIEYEIDLIIDPIAKKEQIRRELKERRQKEREWINSAPHYSQ